MSSSTLHSEAAWHITLAALACLALMAITSTIGVAFLRGASADKNRAVNVRAVDLPDRMGLISNYLDARLAVERRPFVLILGDSQSYGIAQREERTFSALMQRRLPDRAVVNLSVIDARIGDQLVLLQELERRGHFAEIVLLTLNPAHFRQPEIRRLTETKLSAWLFFTSPLKLARLGRIVDDAMADRDRSFEKRPVRHNQYSGTAESERIIGEALITALVAAKRIARRVILYVPPHAIAAYAADGFDLSDFHARTKATIDRCRSVTDVTCLDLTQALPVEAFQDVVHFSFAGHQMMADLLLKEISPSPHGAR